MIGRWQALGICFAAGLAAGWAVNGWRWQAKEGRAISAAVAEAEQKLKDYQTASADFETELAKLRQKERNLIRRLSNETRIDAYRCPIPADGVRILQEARAVRTTSGQPDSTLPAAGR